MLKGLSALVSAAILCGACYFLLNAVVARGLPLADVVLATCATTLFLAVAGVAFGLLAFRRANATAAEFQGLAKSVDGAMRNFASRSDRDTATISGLDAVVSGQLADLRTRLAQAVGEAPAPINETAQPSNVILHPAARRALYGVPAAPVSAQPEPGRIEAAIQHAMTKGPIELSLQPIMSISLGSAAGFEVHAHIRTEDGHAVDLRRPPAGLSAPAAASFEQQLIVRACEAARRRLGAKSEAMPLHVAISGALLGASEELGVVLDLFRQYPLLAHSIVLSVPAEFAEAGGQYAGPLGLIADAGPRLAVEGWSGLAKAFGDTRPYFSFVKLPARRLLERINAETSVTPATALLEAAAVAGIAVIADDVDSDEDAIGLIDLGVNLMSGARFSGPRRLKPDGTDWAERAASN